jgi:hypothetical protein
MINYISGQRYLPKVSSQKEGGSGVLWMGVARPQHSAPRIIEEILPKFIC